VSKPQDSRFPYLPGIDALRALAVLAVFFYHSAVGWMPGGFLGVDVFFAISGYLSDWPHTALIDWAAAAGGDGLTWDGIHPAPAGAGVYARLVDGAVRGQSGAGMTRPATTIPSR
jgi:hypothetical protein